MCSHSCITLVQGKFGRVAIVRETLWRAAEITTLVINFLEILDFGQNQAQGS